jgi:hypothetical protein
VSGYADVYGPDPRLSSVLYQFAAGQFTPGQTPGVEKTEFILVPGIAHPLPTQNFPASEYADEKKLNSGEYRLTLTAFVKYEDMSGRKGETKMTWRYNPSDKRFSQDPYFQYMK